MGSGPYRYMYTKEEGVSTFIILYESAIYSSQHMLESLMPSHTELVGALIRVTLTL